MTVPSMNVNGVVVYMYDSAKRNGGSRKGYSLYHIDIEIPDDIDEAQVHLPGFYKMKVLAGKYLGSSYTEPYRREGKNVICLIQSNISQEKRAAFLAAVSSSINAWHKKSA